MYFGLEYVAKLGKTQLRLCDLSILLNVANDDMHFFLQMMIKLIIDISQIPLFEITGIFIKAFMACDESTHLQCL